MENIFENFSVFGIPAIAAIVIICLLIGEIVKATGIDNKWIPTINGLAGAALGIAAMFIMGDFPARDVITAAAVGIVSGLAATGGYEAFKQHLVASLPDPATQRVIAETVEEVKAEQAEEEEREVEEVEYDD